MSEELEASDRSGTRTISSHSPVSSDSTTPLSSDHPLTHVSPTPTPTRVPFHHTLSLSSFRKRYRSSYETLSPSSSPTLPVQKRYKGTPELILDIDSEGDELEEEEAAPEGQQQVVLIADTSASEPLGIGYGEARRRAFESTEEIAPSTYEVGQSSKSVLEQEGAERIYAFRQPTLVTWVDPEDGRVYTDIPTYVPLAVPVQTSPSLEWSLGSLPVSPSSLLLDALPPTLFEGYDRDLRDLYTRSGVVRDEIFLQRFRSLERERKRDTVTFSAKWMSVLALEAWAGQTDAQRAALWHAIYDIQRKNHDLRRQLAEERRERLELTYRITWMERRQEFGGGSRLYEILD
ncbi:hypothetical protein Tco_0200457 [Tanacetum coccineum]